MSIRDRIAAVRERMALAAERAGRRPSDILLVGVTKTRTVQEIEEAAPFIDAIGENRVQEAQEKKGVWKGTSTPAWRLIGHLQNNKARRALELFNTVDSLDSIALAERLDRIAGEMGRTLPVLIEINTAQEVSKTGIAPEGFPALLDRALELPRLRLEGLMTVGPLTEDEAVVRGAFAKLRGLAEEARARSGLPLPILSMGMSGDFEAAILEGSTMVRVGTLLFGPRNYSTSPEATE